MSKETKKDNQPQFGIVKQFLKDISFECPNSNVNIDESKVATEISVGLETTQAGQDHFEVCLMLNAKATHEKDTVYITEIKYTGIFVAKDIPEEQLEMLLGIEAPQLLFPFARGLLMRVIAESGCNIPHIDPINFGHLYMQAKTQKPESPKEQKKIEEQHA
ncbi:MAG: protein-export chaperone SecB [Proteobacteria bacterium]|nr:protein-export chaperone SecB [Pseudomonadota bacterium]